MLGNGQLHHRQLGLRPGSQRKIGAELWELGLVEGKKRSQMLCLRANDELELVAGDNAVPLAELVRYEAGSCGVDNARVRQLVGEEVCQSPEEFKAWSQNLGHEGVLTTFMSYGSVACERQGEIIRGLATSRQPTLASAEDIAEAVAKRLQGTGAGATATAV
jgi:hypothetical protein